MLLRRRGTLFVVLALALLGVSGCGGDDNGSTDVASLGGAGNGRQGDGTVDGADGEETSFEDGLLAYTECMRDEGVDMPDPQFDSGGDSIAIVGRAPGADARHDDEYQAALAQCAPVLDEAEQSLDPPTPEQQAEMRDQALAFAECMRAEGIDMADPTFGEGGSVGIAIPGADVGGAIDGPAAAGPVSGVESAELDEDFAAAADACSDQSGGIFGAPGDAGVSGTTEDE